MTISKNYHQTDFNDLSDNIFVRHPASLTLVPLGRSTRDVSYFCQHARWCCVPVACSWHQVTETTSYLTETASYLERQTRNWQCHGCETIHRLSMQCIRCRTWVTLGGRHRTDDWNVLNIIIGVYTKDGTNLECQSNRISNRISIVELSNTSWISNRLRIFSGSKCD